MKKRYLFFDIDGTLIAGGYGNMYVPDSTKKALKTLEENGHFISIATGRSEAMARDVMRELGFHNMVSDGGYSVTIDDRLLGIRTLDRDKMIALVDELIEKNIPYALQTENSRTRFAPDERFGNFTHNDSYVQIRIIPGLDARNYEKLYKVYIGCLDGEEEKIEMLKQLPWCRFHETYIFVEPADKAAGIRTVMDHFHADHKDAIVFGDAKNDLSMFTGEWTGVAMGNACEELKKKADLITTDVDKDGIWNACEKLGLL